MCTENPRQIFKPPRPQPNVPKIWPTFPWMFTWPMSAQERLRLTNHAVYGDYPMSPFSVASNPYRDNWQFRDHTCDFLVSRCHVDLRGGPPVAVNLTEKMPNCNARAHDYVVKSGMCCYDTPEQRPPKWF